MKKIDAYHRWVEWSEEDQVYLGMCPDLITGIHGDDAVKLYGEFNEVLEDVIAHLEKSGKELPPPRTRPMAEIS